jgi:hypothetical protein
MGSGAGEVWEEGAVKFGVKLEVAGEDVEERGFYAVFIGVIGGASHGVKELSLEVVHVIVVCLWVKIGDVPETWLAYLPRVVREVLVANAAAVVVNVGCAFSPGENLL